MFNSNMKYTKIEKIKEISNIFMQIRGQFLCFQILQHTPSYLSYFALL